uniref:Uncharacterized protein n=1 Tax=Meloidogyne incognita TaxID=6306 RepID=A0A914NQS9_MELIC
MPHLFQTRCWMVYNILVKLNACKKSNIGWINNLRAGVSLDKNERLIRITPLYVQINQQIRTQASHHVVDTLRAQRFAFLKELF